MALCVTCGSSFADRPNKRFCSDPCRYQAWVKLQPKRYDRHDFIKRIRESESWPKQFPKDIVCEWIEDNLE